MANIIHLMGPTCAGKSTLIDALYALSPHVQTVQIGKLLRKKYGEAHFKGQGAPEHTKNEALSLYYTCIQQGIDEGKKLILVDGQPRDLEQAREMLGAWTEHRSSFMLIHADHHIREARARAGRKPGPDLDLAIARLTNDYQNCYVVMTELLSRGVPIQVVDTSALGFDQDSFCRGLLEQASC